MYFAVFVIDPFMNAMRILWYVVGVAPRKSSGIPVGFTQGIVAKDVILMITHIRQNIIIFIVITAEFLM
jgi:hypothetical protein